MTTPRRCIVKRTILPLLVLGSIACLAFVSCADKGTDENTGGIFSHSYSLTPELEDSFYAADGLRSLIDAYLSDTTDADLNNELNELEPLWLRGVVISKEMFVRYGKITEFKLHVYSPGEVSWPIVKVLNSGIAYVDSLVTVGSDIIFNRNLYNYGYYHIDSSMIRLIAYQAPMLSQDDICSISTPFTI